MSDEDGRLTNTPENAPLMASHGLDRMTDAIVAAATELRRDMADLGDEHPATVYTPEGYSIWLTGIANRVLTAAGFDALQAENADLRASIGEVRRLLANVPFEAWRKSTEHGDDWAATEVNEWWTARRAALGQEGEG